MWAVQEADPAYKKKSKADNVVGPTPAEWLAKQKAAGDVVKCPGWKATISKVDCSIMRYRKTDGHRCKVNCKWRILGNVTT